MNTSDAPARIPSHMVWSILNTVLATILCCTCISIPGIATGIAAIVFSSKVDSLLRSGDIDGARHASGTAKTLNIITTVLIALALISSILYIATVGTDEYMRQMEEIRRMSGQQ